MDDMDKLLEVLKLSKPETDIEDFITAKDLYGQGVIDSLDILVILDEICAAFDIKLGAADLRREDFKTIESLYEMIKRHGGA